MKKLWGLGFISLFSFQAQAQMPNPGFELQNTITGKPAYWQSIYNIIMPVDSNCIWQGLDSVTFTTGEAHSGNYAYEMRVATYCQNALGGNIKAVLYDVDSFVDQRIPFSKRPADFSFYYKLTALLADRAYVEVVLEDSNSHTVADAKINYYQASNWTLGKIPLTYHSADTPAYLTMKFYLRNDWGLHYGTRFLIDDINLEGTTGINDVKKNEILNCYPVPAKDILYVHTGEQMSGAAHLYIVDAMGKQVQSNQLAIVANGETKIDVESLPQGMYFIKLASGNIIASGKFIK